MSIHKTKAGTYRVRWRENGKMQSRNFPRKVDADLFEAKLTVGIKPTVAEAGSYCTGIKFSQFVETWLHDHAQVHKTPAAVINDRQVLRDYLLPRWGKMDLAEVTKHDVVKLQGSLTAEGRLSAKTINNITGLTKKIFNDAVKWDMLKTSPASGVDLIRLPEQDFDFWTFEERDRFLSWTKDNDHDLYEIVAFALNTGLRKGEQEGLLRNAIDLERRQIIVKRKVCEKTHQLQEFTKGKKIRRIPMNQIVFDILKKRAALPMDAPVLPYDYHHIVKRKMEAPMRAAQVSRITFHDLRHTIASHLAMMGVSAFVIKELLGHANIDTTMRYMHLAPDHLDGVTDILLGVKGISSKKFLTPSKNANELFEQLELRHA
ncbi:tyrosine-type recombinase/integrase [Oligoflexus tunisiensis]|uniref:tyrosine-type recombinase/integrase n=1 Tax=Oligoflexus tunisiensis TaxID=708132 RepID=UPI00114CA792|nr:tyrosine-type recombinase/integrase [Oligoflexus tunisiensis]